MNAQQQRVIESFRRIQGWFSANQELVTGNGPASLPALAVQVRAVNEIVETAMNWVSQQQTQLAQSMLVSKDERQQRKEVLSYHMAPIARVAKALRGTVPGIGVLTMPKGNATTAALITAATVMARKSEVYTSVLVEQGLPTDFVQQLDAAAAKLKSSLDARGLARGGRAAASRGLESELALGRRIVTVMDVTLRRVLRDQPAKLAEWQHVQRVTQRGSVGRGGGSAAEVSPTLVEGSPTPDQSSPTLVVQSPTESVGSPIATERAA